MKGAHTRESAPRTGAPLANAMGPNFQGSLPGGLQQPNPAVTDLLPGGAPVPVRHRLVFMASPIAG